MIALKYRRTLSSAFGSCDWMEDMALAMLLNLVVAALAGIFIPLAMERFGRDPAVGSSVFLTFITDSMGFFIFLGLATLFLL